MRLWIICYDIADKRRRTHVACWLADRGASRIQESVFEGRFDHRDISATLAGLANRIEAGEDSVRAYPLQAGAPDRHNRNSGAVQRPPAFWIA